MGITFALIKKAAPIEIMTGEIVESIILGVVWGTLYIIIMREFIMSKWILLNNMQ